MNRRAMEDKRKIDKLFEAGFQGFEPEPPADGWPGIEERLLSEKRKKRTFFWRIASTAAAVVLAFFSGYFFNLEYHTCDFVPVKPPVKVQQSEEGSSQEQKEHTVSEEEFSKDPETDAERESTPADTKTDPPSHQEPSSSAPLLSREKAPEHRTGPAETLQETILEDFAAKTEDTFEEGEDLAGVPEPGDYYIAMEEVPPMKSEVENAQRTATRKPVNSLIPEKASFQTDTPVKNEEKKSEDPLATFDYDQANALKTNKELENKKDDKNNYRRFSIAVAGSPTFAFRNVNVKQSEAAFVSENVKEENIDNSFTAGMDLAYRTGARIEIQTGFYVNNWQQSSDQVFLQGSAGTGTATTSSNYTGNTSSGSVVLATDPYSFTDVSSIGNSAVENAFVLLPNVEQAYRFVEVPFSVGYYLMDKKRWTLSLRTGLSSRFLTNSDVRLIYPDGSEKAYDGLKLNDFTLQLIAGSGVGYRLNKNLKLNLQPSLRYGLTPVYRSDEIDTYFHQFLIFTGVTYQF